MTDQASWLAVQNGQGPFGKNQVDPNPQHMRNGRGLGAYVHVDVLFEAYFNACLFWSIRARRSILTILTLVRAIKPDSAPSVRRT